MGTRWIVGTPAELAFGTLFDAKVTPSAGRAYGDFPRVVEVFRVIAKRVVLAGDEVVVAIVLNENLPMAIRASGQVGCGVLQFPNKR